VLSTMAGAMLIARAMPDQDQAAKAIGAAPESALEAPASNGAATASAVIARESGDPVFRDVSYGIETPQRTDRPIKSGDDGYL
jgi:hypothetical protein